MSVGPGFGEHGEGVQWEAGNIFISTLYVYVRFDFSPQLCVSIVSKNPLKCVETFASVFTAG